MADNSTSVCMISSSRFVGPYTTLSSDLSFVLEDTEGVCGYVLGALDSEKFYERVRKEWLPVVSRKYPKIALLSPEKFPGKEEEGEGERERVGEGEGERKGLSAEEVSHLAMLQHSHRNPLLIC